MDVRTNLQNELLSISKSLDFGSHKTKCPSCSSTRKKNRSDRPLSITVSSDCALYRCHHCGIEGRVSEKQTHDFPPNKNIFKALDTTVFKTDNTAKDWLMARGISEEVIEKFGIIFSKHKFNGSGELPSVGFPYKKDGVTYAVKWRSASDEHKYFTQTKGGAKTFYNLPEKLNGQKRIIIAEGEMDVLSLATAGIGFGEDEHNTLIVSVPNGAPSKVKDNTADDKKYDYLRDAETILSNIDQSILLTDQDTAGDSLKEVLGRRIGKAKSYEVDLGQYKDVNEVLMTGGTEKIVDAIENATPLPLAGLNTIYTYKDSIQELYDHGYPKGVQLGLPSLDRLISFNPSNLFVVTGYPSHGKSELVDEMCIRLAKQGMKTCFASFEKPPQLHALQLASKIVGKPFFKGKDNRMNQEEMEYALEFIENNFVFQDHQAGSPFTIDGILDFASSALLRADTSVLVIDPFNFIDIKQGNQLLTEAINKLLTKVTQWAKQTQSVVLFVAHPAKPANRDNLVATGLDISGSISWYTKADFLISVVRNDSDTDVHVQKVRWNFQGSQGVAKLRYDLNSGRFDELSEDMGFDEDYEWTTDF
ncbi:MAG: hypothetical protein CML19_02685 [Pusillimonas sp.]|nr:hypothetical protein [Pusillimonas sp.]